MSKCVYCQSRKGKRDCPALNGLICSPCCGAHRARDIACPPDCPYLEGHEAYQRDRLGLQFYHERQHHFHDLERLGGQKAIQLLHFLDILTYQFFQSPRGALDAEVLAGLEQQRRKVGPLVLPSSGGSAYGEWLGKGLQDFFRQQGGAEGSAAEVMDLGIGFIKAFSGPGLQSDRYLKGLVGYVDHYYPAVAARLKAGDQKQGRILLPFEDAGTRP